MNQSHIPLFYVSTLVQTDTSEILVQHIAHVSSLHSFQDILHLLYYQYGVLLFDDLEDCLRTAGRSCNLSQCFIWNTDVPP